MIAVDGIILIVSCQKHQTTRLRENNLKENYENWKVIKVIGDLFLDCDYKLEGNLMTIKCEDSYLHILKKMVLSLKYIYEIFDIKEGILRCGDDLIFNENNLVTFLKSSKKNKINDNEYIDIDSGEVIKFQSKDFPTTLEANQEVKEQIYKRICEATISQYKKDSLDTDSLVTDSEVIGD